MRRLKGFTMVELLVVLIILAILIAVAAPMYFGNMNRARASEAVAALGTIRASLREYRISHPSYAYPTLAADNSLTAGIAAPYETGVDVNVGVTQYFSNGAYSISAAIAALSAAPFNTVNAVDFVITADGGAVTNTLCPAAGTPSNCAMKKADVDNVPPGSPTIVKMDNSGTVYASYDNGATWGTY